jgi:predicted dehydrogenase
MMNEPATRRQFVGSALALPAIASLARSGRAALSSAEKQRIRVGQIGTKHAHARGHTRTILKYPGEFELVGIAEPDPEQRARESREPLYAQTPWIGERELLAAPGLQVVAVETEVRDLLATAQRCLDAGLHVHLDKPAGESYSALEKLHATAERKGLTIQMGYMYRYNPGFRFAFRALREGWLGEVFEIHTEMSKTLGPESRRTIAAYPGGSMFELGCHVIDPLVYMMGPPEKVTPYVRRSGVYPDGLADNMLAVLEYPKATATVRSAVIEVDGTRRRQLAICGDQGTLVIQPLEPPRVELTLREPRGGFEKGTQVVDLPEAPGRYDEAWLDFARVIRGEKPHDFSHDHDLAVQRTLLQASQVPLT